MARRGVNGRSGLHVANGQKTTLSRRPALLRVSRLIEPHREGKHNFYRVRGEAFADLLIYLFSTPEGIPKKLKIGDFTLTHHGR